MNVEYFLTLFDATINNFYQTDHTVMHILKPTVEQKCFKRFIDISSRPTLYLAGVYGICLIHLRWDFIYNGRQEIFDAKARFGRDLVQYK